MLVLVLLAAFTFCSLFLLNYWKPNHSFSRPYLKFKLMHCAICNDFKRKDILTYDKMTIFNCVSVAIHKVPQNCERLNFHLEEMELCWLLLRLRWIVRAFDDRVEQISNSYGMVGIIGEYCGPVMAVIMVGNIHFARMCWILFYEINVRFR